MCAGPDSMTAYFSFVFIGKLYAELLQSVARPVHYLNRRKDRRFRPRGRATRALPIADCAAPHSIHSG